MNRSFAPLLVSGLFALSILAGCIGDGGGGAKAKDNAAEGDTVVGVTDTTGAITGIVTDISYAVFFVGATVAVTTDGITVLVNATTDDTGSYYAAGLAPGEYKVIASYADHRPQGKTVTVVAAQEAFINFGLEALPKVEPRVDPPLPLSFFYECGTGFAGGNGEANVRCGTLNPSSSTNFREEFHVSRGISTMVVSARWSAPAGLAVGARDGKPWLAFELVSPEGHSFQNWLDDPPDSVNHFTFSLTEEGQKYAYGDTGNWTLTVLPSSGNASQQYAQNGGLMTQMKVDAWITVAYDNYYLPPEYTGIPEQ